MHESAFGPKRYFAAAQHLVAFERIADMAGLCVHVLVCTGLRRDVMLRRGTILAAMHLKTLNQR